MRYVYLVLFFFVFSVGLVHAEENLNIQKQVLTIQDKPLYEEGVVLVKYRKGESLSELEELSNDSSFQNNTNISSARAKISRIKSLEQNLDLKNISLPSSKFSSKSSYDPSIKVYVSSSLTTQEILTQVNSIPEVEIAVPNYYIYAHHIPNDSYYGISNDYNSSQANWPFKNVSLETAWDMAKGLKNTDTYLAVLDTGVNKHPDLASNLVASFDCMNPVTITAVTECTSSWNPVGYSDNMGLDGNGHGTHVAGTAAAISNNSIGLPGAAYSTNILSFKVLGDSGSGTLLYMLNALNHLSTYYKNKRVVINMSLGFGTITDTNALSYINTYINKALSSGFVIVSSAGNESVTTPSYPAAVSSVLSVGAVDKNNNIAIYSNRGQSWVDVSAPGGYSDCNNSNLSIRLDCILSTKNLRYYSPNTPNSSAYYALKIGTSMASPLVAGVASLVWSANPTLTNTQVVDIIQSTADSDSGKNLGYWKYGRINAYKAVNQAISLLKNYNDINEDSLIDVEDAVLLTKSVLNQTRQYDLNSDSVTNILDFVKFRSTY